MDKHLHTVSYIVFNDRYSLIDAIQPKSQENLVPYNINLIGAIILEFHKQCSYCHALHKLRNWFDSCEKATKKLCCARWLSNMYIANCNLLHAKPLSDPDWA